MTRIAIYESSTGSGPHVAQIASGMVALGHHVEQYRPGVGYDLVLVNVHVPHRTDYCYPQFPDPRIPMALLDFGEYGYFCRLPDRARRWANSFTEDAITHDTKNPTEQRRLRDQLQGRSFPYFLREMHRDIEYPDGYHPIDYPLYHLSVCNERPNSEEYLRRDLELYCSWGASHPWRVKITDALASEHRKAEICTIERDHKTTRLDSGLWLDAQGQPCFAEQGYYFQRMRAAKCSVSYDGYGSGSFRMTEVLCRTLLLQGPLMIRTRAPLIDGETCRAYTVEHEGEEFLSTNIGQVMADALADAEGSYAIYERGYQHCMEHLTEKATAQYVLDTVAAHDWTKPTRLDV